MTIVRESPTFQLKDMFAKGWEVVEFHHRAVDSLTLDYSVLLKKRGGAGCFFVEKQSMGGTPHL